MLSQEHISSVTALQGSWPCAIPLLEQQAFQLDLNAWAAVYISVGPNLACIAHLQKAQVCLLSHEHLAQLLALLTYNPLLLLSRAACYPSSPVGSQSDEVRCDDLPVGRGVSRLLMVCLVVVTAQRPCGTWR